MPRYNKGMDTDDTPTIPGASEFSPDDRAVFRPDDLAETLAAFGATHQIEIADDCIVAVRRPTPSGPVLDVTTGRTVAELVRKLTAERNGSG